MALRAGETLYFRVVDANREFWIVDGYTMNDHDMCWKVKRDRVSGRFFFVNLGVHGKKWRLPDIHDPRFGDESIFPRSSSSHGKRSRSTHNHPHDAATATAAAAVTATPLSAHGYPGSSIGVDFASPGTPPPPGEKASPFDAFEYGGDLLGSSPLRRVEVQQQKEADEARRLDERRVEEMMMRNINKGALMFNNSFDSRASGNNNNSNRSTHHHPSHHDLELALEQEAAKHAAEVQRSLDDTRRMEQSLSKQRERNDQLLVKEMELTSELEKAQLANIEEHANSVRAHVESLRGRTPSPATSSVAGMGGGGGGQHHNQLYPRSQSHQHMMMTAHGDMEMLSSSASPSVLPSAAGISPVRVRSVSAPGTSSGGGGGGHHSPSVMSQPYYQHQQQQQQQGPAIMFTTGAVDPTVVLQEQLDLERRRNEDLRRQIAEKDRIILGTQLSEVERERRDMNLRLRCLEAMAAFRRRKGVHDADRGMHPQQVLRQEPL